MSSINTLMPTMPTLPVITATTVVSGAGWFGGSVGSSLAYCFAPSIIRNLVVSAAQRQFGYYAGLAIGNSTAATIIPQVMPQIVLGASAAGAFLTVAVVATVIYKVGFAGTAPTDNGEPIVADDNEYDQIDEAPALRQEAARAQSLAEMEDLA